MKRSDYIAFAESYEREIQMHVIAKEGVDYLKEGYPNIDRFLRNRLRYLKGCVTRMKNLAAKCKE